LQKGEFTLTFIFLIASIVCAAYGYFKNNNSFIHLGVMLLMLAGWPLIAALIPNIFPRGAQWLFQFIIFMAVMTFIRSKMTR